MYQHHAKQFSHNSLNAALCFYNPNRRNNATPLGRIKRQNLSTDLLLANPVCVVASV